MDDATVGKELVDGLTKFADDLERGDLSGYRITTVRRPMNTDDATRAAERYSMSPGMADQYRAEALAAREALNSRADDENWSPSDVTEAIDLLRSQLTDARRDRERLAAALAPFAREADARPWITNLSDKSGMDEMNIGGSSLTNGDLRAARAALAADAAGG